MILLQDQIEYGILKNYFLKLQGMGSFFNRENHSITLGTLK